MIYLLDSDMLISFFRNREPGLSTIPDLYGRELAISVIVWTEIVFGFRSLPNYEEKKSLFASFLDDFSINVLPLTVAVAEQFVHLKVQLKHNPIGDFDTFIASTALVHDATLVTNNRRHFERVPGLKMV